MLDFCIAARSAEPHQQHHPREAGPSREAAPQALPCSCRAKRGAARQRLPQE